MSNVLAAASKDNTRFTIFENNQVLTADQLNDLFNYLDVQTRLTRTRAIGIGIVCGLEIGQLDNRQIVVSKGTAITSDGDLLRVDADQVFDRYAVFEDNNAKYSYLRGTNGQMVTTYQLSSGSTTNTGDDFAKFEESTNTAIKDYVGVLYLEDYQNDPDLCTGTDCDNKGAEALRELKVLLIHKDNVRLLLQSIPTLNKNFFDLDDIVVPRLRINTSVDTYGELNNAFNEVLAIKNEIKEKLAKAYQVCRPIVEDEFDSGDPVSQWNSLLDRHFQTGSSIYQQYVYDFARDLSGAYNEMRDTLFSGNMLCCPDVQLFPKHVLLGLVKTASITQITPLTSPLSSPVTLSNVVDARLSALTKIRFNLGTILRRFNPIHIDIQYRHHFYTSPILDNGEEKEEQTRFCFKRIHTMITNFKIPTTEEIRSAGEGIKITPSQFEDKLLGERSIPFYYRFNAGLPSHLYWSFDANVKKKEDRIYSYFANQYSRHSATLSPLSFNILPYNFFRIEGHIGFKRVDVENTLNRLILDNNLPINIMAIQLESDKETIPKRDWHFPELHFYEQFVRTAFQDQLDQVEIVHQSIKDSLNEKIINTTDANDLELFKKKKSDIEDSAKNFSEAKATILSRPLFSQIKASKLKEKDDYKEVINKFKDDVTGIIGKTNEIKRQTKEFAFSNTAMPHDFIINTDIGRKADLFADLTNQKIDKKVEEYFFANFLQNNPGLEHTGGVLRGGTFVIVYRSADEIVVADFMLPYASVDKDIVKDPPKPTIPIVPPIKKFDPKVIDIDPPYTKYFNTKVDVFDKRVTEFGRKVDFYDAKFELVGSKVEGVATKVGGLDFKVAAIPAGQGGGGIPADLTAKFEEFNRRLSIHDAGFVDINNKLKGVDDGIKGQVTQIGQLSSQINTFGTRLTEFNATAGTLQNRIAAQETNLGQINNRITEVDTRAKSVETRVNGIDTTVKTLNLRVDGFDNRVSVFDTKLSTHDTRLNQLGTDITGLNSKVDTNIGGLSTRLNTIDTKIGATNVGNIGNIGNIGRIPR